MRNAVLLLLVTLARAGDDERIARIPTAKGARTCLLDAKGERLFVAAPKQRDKPAEIRVYRTAPEAPSDRPAGR